MAIPVNNLRFANRDTLTMGFKIARLSVGSRKKMITLNSDLQVGSPSNFRK